MPLTPNRRQFVSYALGTGSLLLGCRTTKTSDASGLRGYETEASGGLRVRKNVWDLTEKSPEIQAYRAGVAAMRKRAPASPNSWMAWQNIHRDFCPHGNWYFLPWHRAYLNYFEAVCREASGDESFALPYWDWSRDSRIPSFFYDGPLNDPTRELKPEKSVADVIRDVFGMDPEQVLSPAYIREILAQNSFNTFGSLRAKGQMDFADFGSLEGGPHNLTHGSVGGNMGDTGTAATDPIFWLHHCNIDRLWAEWEQANAKTALPPPPEEGQDPTLTAEFWQNFELTQFYDTKGKIVKPRVGDLLSVFQLGYTYDSLGKGLSLQDGDTPLGMPPPPTRVIEVNSAKSHGDCGSGEPSGLQLQDDTCPVPDPSDGVLFEISLSQDAYAVLDQLRTRNDSSFYPIATLHVEGLPHVTDKVGLALLLEQGGRTSHVGAFTWFGHRHAGSTGISLAYEANEALRKLGGAGTRDPLRVRIKVSKPQTVNLSGVQVSMSYLG
jgi:hypothetical protein